MGDFYFLLFFSEVARLQAADSVVEVSFVLDQNAARKIKSIGRYGLTTRICVAHDCPTSPCRATREPWVVGRAESTHVLDRGPQKKARRNSPRTQYDVTNTPFRRAPGRYPGLGYIPGYIPEVGYGRVPRVVPNLPATLGIVR